MLKFKKIVSITALLASFVSCSESNPNEESSLATSSPKTSTPEEADQVTPPSQVAGAFADLQCGTDGPIIICKMRNTEELGAEIYLDSYATKPEFELILSDSVLPEREDASTANVQKFGLITTPVDSKWGLVFDADIDTIDKLFRFLQSSFNNPKATLGVLYRNPKSSEPRLIARLDRCTYLSFLKEWAYGPVSKEVPGTLPTTIQSMLRSQVALRMTEQALQDQKLKCFSAGQTTEIELKNLFKKEILAAGNEWFKKSNNSIKKPLLKP